MKKKPVIDEGCSLRRAVTEAWMQRADKAESALERAEIALKALIESNANDPSERTLAALRAAIYGGDRLFKETPF